MSGKQEELEEQKEPLIEENDTDSGQNNAEELPVQAEEEAISLEDLSQQLAEAKLKADENWDKLLRTQAEMENLRRRTERDLQNAYKFALEKFAKELLPVIDSLELGIEAASGDAADIVNIREGGKLTLKQFHTVLEKFNIVVVDPLDQVFNSEHHQAMSMQTTSDVEPNRVVKVFQKGYLLNDRLLRPAMVVVAQAEITHTKIDEEA